MSTHSLAFFLLLFGWGEPPGEELERVETATPNDPNDPGAPRDGEFTAPVQPVGHSYQETCWNEDWNGSELCATCRKRNGDEYRGCLPNAKTCPDISNQNGRLVCSGR